MKIPRTQMPAWMIELPLASLTLAIGWILLACVVGLAFRGDLSAADEELRSMAREAIRTPELEVPRRLLPVARDLMPGFESNEMFAFLRRKEADDGGLQDGFDTRAAAALARFDAHPTRTLGLVPAQMRPHGFLSHALLHAGVIHALVTAAILLLVAPPLERLWGWQRFVPAAVLMVLAGGGAHVLVNPGGDRALLGGGSLVAGLAAASVARFRAEEVELLAWLPAAAGTERLVPAWILAAAWGLYEVVGWLSMPIGVPGLAHAPGFSAHLAGALAGAGIALAIQRLGWEKQSVAPLPKVPANSRLDLDRVRRLREAGRSDQALMELEEGVKRNPRHRDAVTLFFGMCREGGQAERAAPALCRLIREELRRGADEVAVSLWRELLEHVPNARLDAPSVVRLATLLCETGDEELALAVLEQVLAREGVPGSVLAEVARVSSPISPEVGRKAARIALEDDSLGEGLRHELTALAGGGPEEEPKDDEVPVLSTGKAVARGAFHEERDRGTFGQLGDLMPREDFPAGAVREAVLQSLDLEGFVVDHAEAGELRVDFGRVRAISVVGVQGLGPKPVLLIDVLVDGTGTKQPLSAIRLRSDRFDPSRLAPGSRSGIEALRMLVGQLLAGSEALPLPDSKSVVLRPPRVFESIPAYEEEVLRPAGMRFG